MNAPGSPSSPLQTMYLTGSSVCAATCAHFLPVGKPFVAADGEIFLDGLGIDVTAVLKHAAGLELVERDVLLTLADAVLALIAEAIDEFTAEDGLLDDLVDVVHGDLGVEPAFRLDANQRALFAEAVAAGLLQADGVAAVVVIERNLAGHAQRVHAVLQRLIHVQVAAGDAAGAAADEDFPLFRFARRHAGLLQGAELGKRCEFLSHLLRPPL